MSSVLGGQRPALSKVHLGLLLPLSPSILRACRRPRLPESAGDVPTPAFWALRVPDAEGGPHTLTHRALVFFWWLMGCDQSREVKMPTEALAGWLHQWECQPVHHKVVGSIPGQDT